MLSNQSAQSSITLCHESDPLVHQASFMGDLEKLQHYMRSETHREMLNHKNRLGCTPLRLAATAGHADCVKYLLQCGADVNATDMKAQTSLFVAVKNSRLECIQILLQHGAHPDGDPGCMTSPLFCAAFKGYLAGVKDLIFHGADLENTHLTMSGRVSVSPLQISLTYSHLDCFKELLLAGADPDMTVKTPTSTTVAPTSLYHIALKYCHTTRPLGILYDFGASIYKRNQNGQLPSEVETSNSCLKSYIMSFYERPRSLMQQCRIVIRYILKLGRQLHRIGSLPLPAALVKYLAHHDS